MKSRGFLEEKYLLEELDDDRVKYGKKHRRMRCPNHTMFLRQCSPSRSHLSSSPNSNILDSYEF